MEFDANAVFIYRYIYFEDILLYLQLQDVI